MRGTPHNGFAWDICRIRAMVSGVTLLRLTSRSVGIPIQDQELMPQGRILEEQMAP